MVGSGESCHPPGDEEDFFCAARTLDLRAGVVAAAAFCYPRRRRFSRARAKSRNCKSQREAIELPGSECNQARHDPRRSDCPAGEAIGAFAMETAKADSRDDCADGY